MKKIIFPGSEAGSIMVGQANFLKNPITAFIRLSQGRDMGIEVSACYLSTFRSRVYNGWTGKLPKESNHSIYTALTGEGSGYQSEFISLLSLESLVEATVR